jgi:hypothetical protein
MRRVARSVLLFFLPTLTSSHWLPAQGSYAAPILAGVSNHGQHKREPYVTAGDRTYLIGTQDGNFPDMGDHVPRSRRDGRAVATPDQRVVRPRVHARLGRGRRSALG